MVSGSNLLINLPKSSLRSPKDTLTIPVTPCDTLMHCDILKIEILAHCPQPLIVDFQERSP